MEGGEGVSCQDLVVLLELLAKEIGLLADGEMNRICHDESARCWLILKVELGVRSVGTTELIYSRIPERFCTMGNARLVVGVGR